jgi:phosphopantothenoylcysteine decarboxylase / phosphopantothenate---cysteine ligase
MNRVMWDNPATRANVGTLTDRGVTLVGPASGSQACGEEGPGRMVEPAALITAVYRLFSSNRLSGLKVMVTAGPTREAIDPVRFLSNRSSGRMGYAVARAAAEAGAEVTLVSGPTALTAPAGVELVSVMSAGEMQAAVESRIAGTDIFIAAAAVADYRAARPAEQKMKKSTDGLILSLERTPDILAQVAAQTQRPFTVGFAAETENLDVHARQKLVAKQLDLIAANAVGEGLGFDTEDNALTLYWRDGEQQLSRDTKERLARQLITTIADRYHAQHSNQDSQSTARQ